jgi:adenylyltransferase/sulfurtransferase
MRTTITTNATAATAATNDDDDVTTLSNRHSAGCTWTTTTNTTADATVVVETTTSSSQSPPPLHKGTTTTITTSTQNHDTTTTNDPANNQTTTPTLNHNHFNHKNKYTQQLLDNDTIERYSRQMFIIGVSGQEQLQQSSVLVIGAGGIGSTVLYYLAGAGIGHIDIMDHDIIEISNLHRQIIHSQPGMYKAISAQQALLRFNPHIRSRAICEKLSTENAVQYLQNYHVIVDATDNVISRYIINDACVLLHKPLVSGSAITTQGQLTVYNNHPPTVAKEDTSTGGCYRCMYPNIHNNGPSSNDNACQNCNDAGVLGPVPGLIGILQAMETIKLLTATASSSSSLDPSWTTLHHKLLMYDAMSCSFMTITKPKKNPDCIVCGHHPTIRTMEDTFHDLYHTATSCPPRTILIPPSQGNATIMNDGDSSDISCKDYYDNILVRNVPHVLLDVRVEKQYTMCSLSNSMNIPLDDIIQNDRTKEYIWTQYMSPTAGEQSLLPIYCICRRGIASRHAVRILQEIYHSFRNQEKSTTGMLEKEKNEKETHPSYPDPYQPQAPHPSKKKETTTTATTQESKHRAPTKIYNIVGGYVAWQEQVDSTFPKY